MKKLLLATVLATPLMLTGCKTDGVDLSNITDQQIGSMVQAVQAWTSGASGCGIIPTAASIVGAVTSLPNLVTTPIGTIGEAICEAYLANKSAVYSATNVVHFVVHINGQDVVITANKVQSVRHHSHHRTK